MAWLAEVERKPQWGVEGKTTKVGEGKVEVKDSQGNWMGRSSSNT